MEQINHRIREYDRNNTSIEKEKPKHHPGHNNNTNHKGNNGTKSDPQKPHARHILETTPISLDSSSLSPIPQVEMPDITPKKEKKARKRSWW